MVVKATRSKARKLGRVVRARLRKADPPPVPRFDLREELKRDVARLHRQISRLNERAEKHRAHYREDLNVKWLEKAESVGISNALEAYRLAATRAALINRLYNIGLKHRRLESCETQITAFLQEKISDRPLGRKAQGQGQKLARALYRYLHVDTSKANDEKVRRAWRRFGALLTAKNEELRPLFEVNIQPGAAGPTAKPTKKPTARAARRGGTATKVHPERR